VLALPQGGVLALDLATAVGWAYGLPELREPMFGTWWLPKIGGFGGRLASFENALIPFLEEHQPRVVVCEAPLPLPAQNDMRVCRQQLGLSAIAYKEAYRASAAAEEIDAITVRMAILGFARPRNGKIKEAVTAWCHSRGWRVPDHNAADACMIWEWRRRQVHQPSQSGFWAGTSFASRALT